MLRDSLIVLVMDVAVLSLTGCYIWDINHTWTGMSSIYIAMLFAAMCVVITVIAGMKVERLSVGFLGIIVLWAILAMYDVLTSAAGIGGVMTPVLLLAAFQIFVFTSAWWFCKKLAIQKSNPLKE